MTSRGRVSRRPAPTAFGLCAPSGLRMAPAASRWTCTARSTRPAESAAATASTRKARAREVLQRELPRLLARRDGGARDLLAGGRAELFSPAVEYSFPMVDGSGRRALKTLLWSAPMQAAIAAWMPRPCIEDVVVASPSREELDVKYTVRCAAVTSEDCDPGEDSCFAAAAASPRVTVLRVRTRLRFDESGRICVWRDTWDRAATTVMQEMLAVAEGAREKERAEAELKNRDGSERMQPLSQTDLQRELFGMVGEKEIPNDKLKERPLRDDSEPDLWAKEETEMWSKAFTEGEYAPGISAAKVADELPLKGEVLTTAAAAVRAQEIQDFLSGDFGRLSVSNCGRPFYELLGEEPYSKYFHEGAILETPNFIVGGGPESLSMMHALSRFSSWFNHSEAEVACLSVDRQTPRTFVATYILRGRSRFTGSLVQEGAQVKVRVDASGSIVHCILEDFDPADDCFDLFSRTSKHPWVW